MIQAEVNRLCDIATKAGAKIERWDYDFSAGCYFEHSKANLLIAEVYRPERDGYTGSKIITDDLLQEWLEKNKP